MSGSRDSFKFNADSVDGPIPINHDPVKGPVIVWRPCDVPRCLMCSGEACNLCGVGGSVMLKAAGCEHDQRERHQEPATGGIVDAPPLFGQADPPMPPLHFHDWVEGDSGALTCTGCGLMTEAPLLAGKTRPPSVRIVDAGFTIDELAAGARRAANAGFTTRQAAEAMRAALRARHR